METDAERQSQGVDNKSFGVVAFIIGLIGLVMVFIPLIGVVAWLLAPLAILCGGIAIRRSSGAFGIIGLILGLLTLAVCISWLRASQAVSGSIEPSKQTTNSQPLENAPAMASVSVQGLRDEFEENRIAALSKYSGRRLLFRDEEIRGFRGDAARPLIEFAAREDQYLTYLVPVPFSASESDRIIGLRKGQKVTFICEDVREGFGQGFSLSNCSLR